MKLFKIDSKGKIRVLLIQAIQEEVVRTAGIYKGNLVTTTKWCKPKNVGKANATNAIAQASAEVLSERMKKIREGYVEIPDTIVEEKTIRQYILDNSLDIPDCMLAKPFHKRYFTEGKRYLASSKLDGMRCMAVISPTDITLYSRGRKEILTMPHIVKALSSLIDPNMNSTVILDGELYYHDKYMDNFQEVMSSCKKYRKGLSELVQYHVYELIDEKLTAEERYAAILPIVRAADSEVIVAVSQREVSSMQGVEFLHASNLEQGYEGTMLKGVDSMYRQGARSSDLLKFKDFSEEDFEVIDIIPMDFNPKYGMAVVKLPDGQSFNVTPKMSYSLRETLLEDKDLWIGGVATVKFFGYTDKGIPRIASLRCITVKGDLEDFRIGNK